MSDNQNPQVQSPALAAFQALVVLIETRPWFETHEHHLKAHTAFNVLLAFIKEKLQAEQAPPSVPPLSVVPE